MMRDLNSKRRPPPVRWKPRRKRMAWQTPVIVGLLSFAIVMAAMMAIDKWPALSRISVASLSDRLPAARQISLPSLSTFTGGLRVIDGDTVVSGGDHYRLVGFDTPEKDDLARCESERLLAARDLALAVGAI